MGERSPPIPETGRYYSGGTLSVGGRKHCPYVKDSCSLKYMRGGNYRRS